MPWIAFSRAYSFCSPEDSTKVWMRSTRKVSGNSWPLMRSRCAPVNRRHLTKHT